MKFPDATGIEVWGPGPFEKHHYLELAWFAIHPIEILYTLMGPVFEEVTRTAGPQFDSVSDVIAERWKDARLGTVRTKRSSGPYGAVVFRPKQVVQSASDVKYS